MLFKFKNKKCDFSNTFGSRKVKPSVVFQKKSNFFNGKVYFEHVYSEGSKKHFS